MIEKNGKGNGKMTEQKENKDKILFLDIDGVLNTHGTARFYHYLNYDEKYKPKSGVKNFMSEQFCNSAVGNLIEIIKQTDCKIVVSSTWRLGRELHEMKAWFENFPIIQDAIIGKTLSVEVKSPNSNKDGHQPTHNVPRGLECDMWLTDNGYNSYWDKQKIAIVDDDADMWPLEKCFFQTRGYDGLTYSVAEKIIKHLNAPDRKLEDVLIKKSKD